MTFHVGQRVICVRDAWSPSDCGYLPPNTPKAGCEYVVRSICRPPDGHNMAGLRFHWMFNPAMRFLNGLHEPAFATHGFDGILNFRPIVEQKTDISIFTAMLNPSDQKVIERV